jgi:hypothetical protein
LMIYSKENENGANFQKRERKKRSEWIEEPEQQN